MGKLSSSLNYRQERFITEYVRLNGNGTQAAIAAGYATSGADVQAIRLLANDRIRSAIEDYKRRSETRACLTLAEKRAKIAEIVTRPGTRDADILKALELDAKLAGEIVMRSEQQVAIYNGDANRERLGEIARAALQSSQQIVASLP